MPKSFSFEACFSLLLLPLLLLAWPSLMPTVKLPCYPIPWAAVGGGLEVWERFDWILNLSFSADRVCSGQGAGATICCVISDCGVHCPCWMDPRWQIVRMVFLQTIAPKGFPGWTITGPLRALYCHHDPSFKARNGTWIFGFFSVITS